MTEGQGFEPSEGSTEDIGAQAQTADDTVVVEQEVVLEEGSAPAPVEEKAEIPVGQDVSTEDEPPKETEGEPPVEATDTTAIVQEVVPVETGDKKMLIAGVSLGLAFLAALAYFMKKKK